MIELTVPWESRIEVAHERKLLKYADLQMDCEAQGWECWLYAVEVGCRGFLSHSLKRLLCDLGIRGRESAGLERALQESVETASAWIVDQVRRAAAN